MRLCDLSCHSNEMADPYESNDSEDVSSFLQILLHNSSSSAAASDNNAAAAGVYYGGGGTGTAVAESSSSINFSDPGRFFVKESDGMNSYSKESQAHEAPANPHPPRSSKRSRAAEVHNLSEKRRRSRINEKLKALQKLIPNSNKTDKASMLDEAIEYLKQLQLQVQMLTVRNGLSLHPSYSLGSLQSMLASSAGMEFDEGNTFVNEHRVAKSTLNHQNVYVQSTVNTDTNLNINSTQPTSSLVPSIPNTCDVAMPSFVPSMQNHYGLLNHLASSKDICRDDTLSQMQLDVSCSRNNSSPGVSSS